jgi:predicted PurR-regulated permease PerM
VDVDSKPRASENDNDQVTVAALATGPVDPAQVPVAVAAGPVDAGQVFRWTVAAGLGLLAVALGALAVYSMQTLLVQMIIAVFIAVSLEPLVRWMIRRGMKRAQAVALIFMVALLVITGLVWLFAPDLMRQAGALTTDFPGYIDKLRQQSPDLRNLEDRFNLAPRIDQWVQTVPTKMSDQAISVSRQFLGALVSVLLVIVMTIYLMADLSRLRRGLVRLFPKRHRPQVSEAINLIIDKVGAYMIGNLLISGIAGVTAFIALWLLGVPFALPLALMVAITDLIPLIGATLGAAICMIVSVATTDIWPTTILVGLFFLLYQQVENYVIVPRVLRNTVDISSVAVLFAALVGASVLGVIGALLAIPVAAALKAIISDWIRARDEDDVTTGITTGTT